jgi:hypothetical protein
MDSYVRQVAVEEGRRRRLLMPLARIFLAVLRRSRRARQWVVEAQNRFTPTIYRDLYDQYKPDLVVASTYGWRLDRYVLREAVRRGIETAAVIVGWDNPSSYGLGSTQVKWVSCWSEVQKQELELGSGWPAEHIHIGGIPSYDGYYRGEWLLEREAYFASMGLIQSESCWGTLLALSVLRQIIVISKRWHAWWLRIVSTRRLSY